MPTPAVPVATSSTSHSTSHSISNNETAALMRASEAIVPNDEIGDVYPDPVPTSPLVILHAMRAALADADPAALSLAGVTSMGGWVLPAGDDDDRDSHNDAATCRVCPLVAMSLQRGWIEISDADIHRYW